MSKVHVYHAACSWAGATGAGYESYSRAHDAWSAPATPRLHLSSDRAFRGSAELLNPEQLLVMAATSCQLLSFLACAARAGVDVRRYEDDAEALMPAEQAPIRITRIRLRPRIEVAHGPTEERVRELSQQAHEECYIASSLKAEVTVEPSIVFVAGS